MEQEKRSQVIQEILDFDHSLLMNVETVYKDKLPSADGKLAYVIIDIIGFYI